VQLKGLFTSFPDLETEGSGPSKRQLKKMAKAQATKEQKKGEKNEEKKVSFAA